MAWSHLGNITGNYDTVGDENVSLSSLSLQEGDLVIVAQSADSSLASLGLDRDQGFTFPYSPADTSPGRLFAWKIMTATPDSSLDFSPGSAYHCYVIQGWRGADSTQPDQSPPTEATGASANPDSASITTQSANALVFTIAHMDDDDTTVSGTPSSYTNMTESNTGQSSTTDGATVALASREIASAGAEDPGQWTFGASDAWAANTISFAIAASGSVIPAVVHHRKMLGMQ